MHAVTADTAIGKSFCGEKGTFMTMEQLDLTVNIITYVMVFLFGITVGSFLNVCIYRIPLGQSIAKENSHCMTCGTPIKRYDLIPLFSWLFLGGKCRACKAKIPARYPLVEFLNGALWVLAAMKYPFAEYGVKSITVMLFFSVLVVIGFMDWDTQEIAVSLLIFCGLFAVADYLMQFTPYVTGGGIPLVQRLIGAAAISISLLLVGFVFTPLIYSLRDETRKAAKALRREIAELKADQNADESRISAKEKTLSELEAEIKENGPVFGFGMGDVLLMIGGGFMLGWHAVVVAAFIGILIGAIGGMILRRRSGESKFAFGPFLSIGLVCGVFFGEEVFSWYISMMIM